VSISAEEFSDLFAELVPFDDDLSDLEFWASMLMKPSNIDNHTKYLRSAWEGASAYIKSHDPDHAQGLVNTIVRSVDNRSDDEPPTPRDPSSR
jgi:hypothetical protein